MFSTLRANRRGVSRTVRPCRVRETLSKEFKSDLSLGDAERGSEASRRTIEGGMFPSFEFEPRAFFFTLDALGHPALEAHTPLCKQAKCIRGLLRGLRSAPARTTRSSRAVESGSRTAVRNCSRRAVTNCRRTEVTSCSKRPVTKG